MLSTGSTQEDPSKIKSKATPKTSEYGQVLPRSHITNQSMSLTEREIRRQVSYNKVSRDTKIWNRYNQIPHLTQDTNGKVTNSQSDSTNESQEVSPFPAGDHKVHINRHAQRHSRHKTEKHKKKSTKAAPPWKGQ